FQAEDGIRVDLVTGVQTCALPISLELLRGLHELIERGDIPRDAPERVTAALEAERGLRDRPTLVGVADQVGLLGARVGHEDFRRSEERRGGKGWRGWSRCGADEIR